MTSPYIIELHKFKLASNHEYNCSPNLGIDNFRRALSTGLSASGMSFGTGIVNKIDVFVKLFIKPCQFNLLRPNLRKRKIVDDANELEIGITSLISSLLIPVTEKVFTQNLIFLYGYHQCQYAFESDNSQCTGTPIPPQKYWMVSQKLCNEIDAIDKYAQCRYIPRYYESEGRQPNQIDDTINYMVVERASGDLENLLDTQIDELIQGVLTIKRFDEIWDSIIFQIIYTLAVLNNIFSPFVHGDMGLRNVLYSKVPSGDSTYFSYTLYENTYNVENTGFIPKLWDFSNTLITRKILDVMKIDPHFRYLDDIQKARSIKLGDTDLETSLSQLIKTFHPNFIKWSGNVDSKISQYSKTRLFYNVNIKPTDNFIVMLKSVDTYRGGKFLLEPKFQYP